MALAFGPSFSRNSRISFARPTPPSVVCRHMALDSINDDGDREEDDESPQETTSGESLGSAADNGDDESDSDSVMASHDESHADAQEEPAQEVIYIVFEDASEDELLEEKEDDEDDDEEPDPYSEKASSEFLENGSGLDWGGALGKLRERVSDVESGASQSPSTALFRVMTSQTPNQVIGEFVNTANPQVVAAMSGAVSSLLGGLSSPAMGVETVVKASGEKIGSLCFQLQMTG